MLLVPICADDKRGMRSAVLQMNSEVQSGDPVFSRPNLFCGPNRYRRGQHKQVGLEKQGPQSGYASKRANGSLLPELCETVRPCPKGDFNAAFFCWLIPTCTAQRLLTPPMQTPLQWRILTLHKSDCFKTLETQSSRLRSFHPSTHSHLLDRPVQGFGTSTAPPRKKLGDRCMKSKHAPDLGVQEQPNIAKTNTYSKQQQQSGKNKRNNKHGWQRQAGKDRSQRVSHGSSMPNFSQTSGWFFIYPVLGKWLIEADNITHSYENNT